MSCREAFCREAPPRLFLRDHSGALPSSPLRRSPASLLFTSASFQPLTSSVPRQRGPFFSSPGNLLGFPVAQRKESACTRRCQIRGSTPRLGRFKKGMATHSSILSGLSHGQRRLLGGYSPCGVTKNQT